MYVAKYETSSRIIWNALLHNDHRHSPPFIYKAEKSAGSGVDENSGIVI